MTVSVAAPVVMAAAPARLVVLRKSRRSWSMKASLDWFAACHAWHACAYCRLFPAPVDHGRAPRAGEGAIVAANRTGAPPEQQVAERMGTKGQMRLGAFFNPT